MQGIANFNYINYMYPQWLVGLWEPYLGWLKALLFLFQGNDLLTWEIVVPSGGLLRTRTKSSFALEFEGFSLEIGRDPPSAGSDKPTLS